MKSFKDTKYGDLTGEIYNGEINICCDKIKSLKGSPNAVNGKFVCKYCKNLKDLQGAPEIVDGNFNCSFCENLKDLKGAPEIVGGTFNCANCKIIETLKGAPKKCKKIICNYCNKLKNLNPLLQCDIEEIKADKHLLEDYNKKKSIVEKHGYDKAMEIIEVMDKLI